MSEHHHEESRQRLQTACLLILTFLALGVVLNVLRPVIVPFVFALLFTYCLTPIIDFQVRRLKLPWVVAVLSTALLGFVLLLGAGIIVAMSVSEMTSNLGAYKAKLTEFTTWALHHPLLQRLGVNPDTAPEELFNVPRDTVTALLGGVLAEGARQVSNGLLVMVFVLFLIMGRGASAAEASRPGVLREIELQMRLYLIQLVLFSGVTALLVGFVLMLLGVPFAWVFAFLTFLLNFIPNVGSVVATLLPLPVVLLSPELSTFAKITAIAVPGAIQAVLGAVVQPRIQGKSFDLHPVTVLLSLLFFSMIWGLAGAFLATPMTVVTKIILSKIPATRPLAAILAGKLDSFDSPEGEVPPCPTLADGGAPISPPAQPPAPQPSAATPAASTTQGATTQRPSSSNFK
ncbi:MAG: AI-2E family transporter [Planctomycetota bacterium]|nr:AI-2E family transporter [Planctomycetota bacterium]